VLTLSSNVSDAFPKVIKLSSEVSECKPLDGGPPCREWNLFDDDDSQGKPQRKDALFVTTQWVESEQRRRSRGCRRVLGYGTEGVEGDLAHGTLPNATALDAAAAAAAAAAGEDGEGAGGGDVGGGGGAGGGGGGGGSIGIPILGGGGGGGGKMDFHTTGKVGRCRLTLSNPS